MDAIRMIKQDHRKVESLFEQFETLIGLPGEGRTRLIDEICEELAIHTRVEEELLYPAARQVLDPGVIDHAEEEHDEADRLIARVRDCDPGGTEVEQWMQELKRSVLHHVEEEERNFLPQMEEACAGDILETLGEQIEVRKEQFEASQHPLERAAASMAANDGGTEPGGLLDLTKEELYEKAQQADIPGRSKMTKAELANALSSA